MRLLDVPPLVLLLVLLGACLDDPRRGNPFDPRSEDFVDEGRVEGLVTGFYAPFTALPGVDVALEPGAGTRRSGADGRFVFDGVPAGRYVLHARRDGYAAAVETVDVAVGPPVHRELRLDGLPGVAAVQLHTVHIARWWPRTALRRLEVQADAEDPDGLGDVVDVWLEVPALGFVDTLVAVAGRPERFVRTVDEASLPGGRLEALLGLDVFVRLRDRAGVVGGTAPLRLARVVDAEPLAAGPQGFETVGAQPALRWQPMALPFAHTFRVDVSRDDAGFRTPMLRAEGLPSTTTAFTLPEPLPPGVYFWTVSVVDAFGNRSQSREAGFEVGGQ